MGKKSSLHVKNCIKADCPGICKGHKGAKYCDTENKQLKKTKPQILLNKLKEKEQYLTKNNKKIKTTKRDRKDYMINLQRNGVLTTKETNQKNYISSVCSPYVLIIISTVH